MKAVVLAAKKNDSLFPYTETRPVGLIPVGGKPLVRRTVEKLFDSGVKEIYLVVNYEEEQYREEFRDEDSVKFVRQETLDGTASAVNCCDFLEEDFLVINGDVLVSDSDISALIQKHSESTGEATVLGTHENRPEKFGVLSIVDDRIESIMEKPEDAETTLVNTGIYCFSPEVFKHLNSGITLPDAVMAVKTPRFEVAEDYWIDIGRNSKLLEADRTAREPEIEESAEVSEKAHVGKDCYIGENVEIKPGSVVENCTVCENSTVRGTVRNSFVMEKVETEPSVSVERSIVGEHTKISAGSALEECFIGPEALIGLNNSMRGVKTVPGGRTDLGEISK